MNPSTRSLYAEPAPAPPAGSACTLLPMAPDPGSTTEALYERLEDAGCPLAPPVRDRIRFEGLLADLSANFVNVPADQVDAQILAGLRHIVEFLGIDRSGFGQLVPGENSIAITHSYQVDGVPPTPKVILEAQFPVYARKVHEGVPFRLPDDIQDIEEAAAEREYLSRSGLKSHLTIPLKVTGAVVGGIGFASFRARLEWPGELVRRLRLVGDIFTNALARKQADEALRALASKLLTAQEEERRRVAREMHDDWTQRLAVLGLEVARLEKAVDDPAVAAPLLRTIQERLLALSGDVHDLSRQLHPAILDDLGLVEALRSECAAFTRRERIAVDYRADAVPHAVAPDVALCVYRVAQEALRNLAKHAAVSRCRVTLTAAAESLELTVRDEGVGFDPAAVRHEAGIGLASMEERVRLVRARLTVTSAPGQGTTVAVRAPLEDANP
jgi:signal transduction histidine kinase